MEAFTLCCYESEKPRDQVIPCKISSTISVGIHSLFDRSCAPLFEGPKN